MTANAVGVNVYHVPTDHDGCVCLQFLDNSGNPEVLELSRVTLEDAGEYRCLAGNVWGLKYSSAYLTVNPIVPTTGSELPL